jgi:hypothetical protein
VLQRVYSADLQQGARESATSASQQRALHLAARRAARPSPRRAGATGGEFGVSMAGTHGSSSVREASSEQAGRSRQLHVVSNFNVTFISPLCSAPLLLPLLLPLAWRELGPPCFPVCKRFVFPPHLSFLKRKTRRCAARRPAAPVRSSAHARWETVTLRWTQPQRSVRGWHRVRTLRRRACVACDPPRRCAAQRAAAVTPRRAAAVPMAACARAGAATPAMCDAAAVQSWRARAWQTWLAAAAAAAAAPPALAPRRRPGVPAQLWLGRMRAALSVRCSCWLAARARRCGDARAAARWSCAGRGRARQACASSADEARGIAAARRCSSAALCGLPPPLRHIGHAARRARRRRRSAFPSLGDGSVPSRGCGSLAWPLLPACVADTTPAWHGRCTSDVRAGRAALNGVGAACVTTLVCHARSAARLTRERGRDGHV